MRKMLCSGIVFDTLTDGHVVFADWELFDLIFRACCAMACEQDKGAWDAVHWIAKQESAPDDWAVAARIHRYFRKEGIMGLPGDIMDKAIAAGRAAMGKDGDA